jgi:hypothetical protein
MVRLSGWERYLYWVGRLGHYVTDGKGHPDGRDIYTGLEDRGSTSRMVMVIRMGEISILGWQIGVLRHGWYEPSGWERYLYWVGRSGFFITDGKGYPDGRDIYTGLADRGFTSRMVRVIRMGEIYIYWGGRSGFHVTDGKGHPDGRDIYTGLADRGSTSRMVRAIRMGEISILGWQIRGFKHTIWCSFENSELPLFSTARSKHSGRHKLSISHTRTRR